MPIIVLGRYWPILPPISGSWCQGGGPFPAQLVSSPHSTPKGVEENDRPRALDEEGGLVGCLVASAVGAPGGASLSAGPDFRGSKPNSPRRSGIQFNSEFRHNTGLWSLNQSCIEQRLRPSNILGNEFPNTHTTGFGNQTLVGWMGMRCPAFSHSLPSLAGGAQDVATISATQAWDYLKVVSCWPIHSPTRRADMPLDVA